MNTQCLPSSSFLRVPTNLTNLMTGLPCSSYSTGSSSAGLSLARAPAVGAAPSPFSAGGALVPRLFLFPRMAITHQNRPHVPRAFHRFGRDLATWSPPTLITACYESWTSNLHKVMVPSSPVGFGFRSLSSLAAAKIENGLSLSVVISPPPKGLL